MTARVPISARYKQPSTDRRKRAVDLRRQLEATETVQSVDTSVFPAGLAVGPILVDPNGKRFAYFSEGGESGRTYRVTFVAETQVQRITTVIEIAIW